METRHRIVRLLLGAAATFGLLLAADRALVPASGTFAAGLVIAGLPVGGAEEDARAQLDEFARRAAVTPVRIYSGEHHVQTRVQDLGGKFDTEAALAAAREATERRRRWFGALRALLPGGRAPEIELPLDLDPAAARRQLREFAAAVDTPARSARLVPEGDELTPVEGAAGHGIDFPALVAEVRRALVGSEFRAGLVASLAEPPDFQEWARTARPAELNAPLGVLHPAVTLADLEGIDTILATFATSAGGSSRDRLHNIRLASEAIDGLVLRPGEVFSYNGTVGPRTVETGYRKAPVILDGRLVPGIGGGICQVSTGVYNAALLADLEVAQRRPHSFPVAYVAAGRDASVDYGIVDLEIRNTLPRPVMLAIGLEGTRVVARVYGHAADKREVRLLRTAGEPITWTRLVKTPDGAERREVVSRDVYRLAGPVEDPVEPEVATAPEIAAPEEAAEPDSPGGGPGGPAGVEEELSVAEGGGGG